MSTVRTKKMSGLVAMGLLAAVGCNAPKQVPASAQQGGSLGLTDSGSLVVAALDNDGVVIVDPAAATGGTLIATGTRPEKLIVRGNTVYVANRLSRTVTQVDATTKQVVRQIAVGAEPMGLDTMPDGTLLVANAMSGTIQAINPEDGSTRWTADLGDQVRTVAALPDGRIFAPSYKNGLMHVIDAHGKVNTEIAMVQPVSDPDRTRQISAVEHILVNPIDKRVYVPHSASLSAPLPPAVTGYYSRPPPTADFAGGASASPIAPAVSTVTFDGDTLLKATDSAQDFPPPVFTAGTGFSTNTFAGPKVAALDPSGTFLYVVNQLSNNIAVISTRRGAVEGEYSGQGVMQIVAVGQGPDGIAVARDDRTIYVNNAFDHSISVITLDKTTGLLSESRRITSVAPQTLTPAQQRGRVLFNTASDPRVSAQGFGGVSCASCHPGGREDGHTWHFAEGARNTPALVGRGLEKTAPYHWDGELADPEAFRHVVQVRMGGSGLDDSEYEDIFAWLEHEPAPDNPNRLATGLTEQQQKGRDLFMGTAGCASCHSTTTDLFTDNRSYDVGTQFTTADIDIISSTGFVSPNLIKAANPNTPSLLGVFASAPYLHDGTFATLEERIRSNPNGKHGNTDQLSDDDVKALAAYVKTL